MLTRYFIKIKGTFINLRFLYWFVLTYSILPSVQVEVKAVPIDMDPTGDDYKRMRRQSRPDEGSLTYGGHPPPCLDTQYEVTVTDKKEAFHAISIMKVF